MTNIIAQGFLTRNIVEYLTDSSRIKYYRINTIQNPLAYQRNGKLLPIDLSSVKNSSTVGAGNIWLRDRNIVSLGIKKSDDAYKCIGLRPDEDQSGNEQLEWSIENIEVNSKAKTINLSQKQIVSSTINNLGPLLVESNRQRTRIMLPMINADEGFRIALRLHLTGLNVKYHADLDEYWIYNSKGQFRFRLRKPKIIGLEDNSYEPIDLGGQWVKHSLQDNLDGTYTYIKEPGIDFAPSKLPKQFWIDADTVYSDTTDGIVGNNNIEDTWSNVRNAATGTAYKDDRSYGIIMFQASVSSGEYSITRAFFYYDLSTLSGTVTACNQYIMGYLRENNVPCIQQGAQASPLSVNDFDSFTGTLFDTNTAWNSDSFNVFEFNSAGLSYINSVIGGTAKLCLRDKTYDYDDLAPSQTFAGSGGYFADNEGTTYDPYLYVTIGSSGWTGKIMGVTNPAKILGIDAANIAKVGGI